jgi:multicomponent Na+:H+ antiporter subunit D
MTKIWAEAFWKEKPNSPESLEAHKKPTLIGLRYASVILLAAVTLWISFNPDSLMQLAQVAAKTIINPSNYIEAVIPSAKAGI